jgi:8-oxo-dGTP diphosphatase
MSSGREFPDRPLVGVGVAVLRGHSVLLVRRARPPAQGAWSLPGGAQQLGETAENAARRELLEETGLTVGPLWLAGYVDSVHRDPDGRIRYHYTILDLCAAYSGGEAQAGSDATDIAWADLDRLDDFGLWAEARRIIGLARARLTQLG